MAGELDGPRAFAALDRTPRTHGRHRRTVASLLAVPSRLTLTPRCYDADVVLATLRRPKYRLENNPGYEPAVAHIVCVLQGTESAYVPEAPTVERMPIALALLRASELPGPAPRTGLE
jgi:hypothetical protein